MNDCPFCESWSPPRNCGHGLINGEQAPRAYFTRPFVLVLEVGSKVARCARLENQRDVDRRLEYLGHACRLAQEGGWKKTYEWV